MKRGSAGESAGASQSGSTPLRPRWGWIVLFVLYALGLATATHWPDVKLPGPQGLHPDKLVHGAAFTLWTALLLASGLLGSWRRGRVQGLALAAAALMGGLDEATQMIPGLGREVSLWDAAANLGGACLAVAAAAILATRRGWGG